MSCGWSAPASAPSLDVSVVMTDLDAVTTAALLSDSLQSRYVDNASCICVVAVTMSSITTCSVLSAYGDESSRYRSKHVVGGNISLSSGSIAYSLVKVVANGQPDVMPLVA